MSLADEMAYGLKALLDDQGGTITYRRVTKVAGSNPAPNPPTYIGLVLDGAAVAGASTVDMGVDAAQGGVFTGRLIAGDTFQIAGDPTVYVVSAPVTSPSTSDTLTAVPFAPVLAQDAADRVAITLGFAADTPGIPAAITDFASHLTNGTTIQQSDQKIRFLASSIAGVEPIAGDFCILPGGEIVSVITVSHLEIQGVHYGWTLQVRQ